MKLASSVCLFAGLCSAAALGAADAPTSTAPPPTAAASAAVPELRGVLATATEKRFNLSFPATGRSEWVTVGDMFGDWKLAEYRDADSTLVLRQAGGADVVLSLAASHVTAAETKATAADAEAVLQKMNLAKIFAQALDPQRKALLEAAQRIAAKAGLNADSGDAYAAYQKQAAAAISAALDPKEMESDIATIYSNVFTKDELAGLGDFFDSTAGQAYAAKAPEVQKELQAILVPRIQAVVPQLQALAAPPPASAPASP